MKKIFFTFLMSAFVTNLFAGPMLITHACKGVDSDGATFTVNVHMDENIFCSEDLNQDFSGALVFNQAPGPEQLIVGKIAVNTNNFEMRFSVSADVQGQQVEVVSLDGLATENYQLKMLKSENPIEFETVKLTCDQYIYEMDC